ncbi:MAG: DUF3305 domain-containing protein [Hyphomicrobiaceae bacterium]|nr:DUF3305 domain-containing protein [Hyphomicrobiaceae bacterium]
MSAEFTIPVGVVVAREKIDHPWQEYRWRSIGVFLDAPEKADWRPLMKQGPAAHYHAATVPLVLHRKETMSYQVNLANGEPSIYVVLREDHDADSGHPVSVHAVTASPFEAQTYGEMAFDTVDRVQMPERLVSIIKAFIAEHPMDEAFVKRQRQPHVAKDEPHAFGQEPIVILRERMAGRTLRDSRGKPRGEEPS